MMVRAIFCALAILSASVSAQNEPVTYHDLATMSPWPLGNMKARGAMGTSASLAIAEMPPGALGRAGNAHHHAQEQIVVGTGGSPIGTIAGVPYRHGTYGGSLVPPNVEHATINGLTSAPSTFIEFQPVRRLDWFPPHPKAAFPQDPSPTPLPSDRRVFENFDPSAAGWAATGSARSKSLGSQSVRFTMWDLSATNATAEITQGAGTAERFVYVFEGQAQLVVDGRPRELTTQTLAIVSPTVKGIGLRSLANVRTLVGVFEAIVQ
jgi:hypothetical protein